MANKDQSWLLYEGKIVWQSRACGKNPRSKYHIENHLFVNPQLYIALFFLYQFYTLIICLDLGCANEENIQLRFQISSFNLIDVRALLRFLRMILNSSGNDSIN